MNKWIIRIVVGVMALPMYYAITGRNIVLTAIMEVLFFAICCMYN